MISEERKINAIALSIMSSPAQNGLWENIVLNDPVKIFEGFREKSRAQTQEYIEKKYNGCPIESAKRIYDECGKKCIEVVDYWDDAYPNLLRQISRPPVVLYLKGRIKWSPAVAIVGTRKSCRTSAKVAFRISSEMAHKGITVVSGMAVGIDRQAHLGALSNNGSTLGVLANGIDIHYPRANLDIYEAIEASDNSFLISEYPPGIYAGRWTFVRRNRIISGLSLGTVIVKAAEKSGALITARYALEQNREVFVCPGNTFDDSYKGCIELIKNGARPISDTGDIFEELRLNNACNASSSEKRIPVPVKKDNICRERLSADMNIYMNCSPLEKKIIELLSAGDEDIDMVVRKLECCTNSINEAIVMLEISGLIERNGNIISRV